MSMPSDPNEVNLIYIVTGLLVPIIPAFIIYRFLPSKTYVQGPFKGLKINLTGAFAGYFVLVLIVLYNPRPKTEGFEMWTIKGLVNADSPVEKDDEIVVTVIPPVVEVNRQPGEEPSFVTSILATRKADGSVIFPKLRVDRQPVGTFDPVTFHLDEEFYKSFPDRAKVFTITRDTNKHEMMITTGISVKKSNLGKYIAGPAGTP
jgi:hypothetical protein